MGDHLATIDMGQKLGALPHFWGGGAGSPSDTMLLGSRPTFLPSGILIHPWHPAIWPQQIWAENWGLCPFGGEESGSPSNTMGDFIFPLKPSFKLGFKPNLGLKPN